MMRLPINNILTNMEFLLHLGTHEVCSGLPGLLFSELTALLNRRWTNEGEGTAADRIAGDAHGVRRTRGINRRMRRGQ